MRRTTVINKNWFDGTIQPGGSMDIPGTEINLYVTVSTIDVAEEEIIGINYSNPAYEGFYYDWESRKANLQFSFVDDFGGEFSIWIEGEVIAEPPVANANEGLDINLGCEAEYVPFDASYSSDRDDDLSTYVWSFQNAAGIWKDYFGKVVDVPMPFEVGSSTNVMLTTIDDYGLIDYDDLVVDVGEDDKEPVVDGIYTPVSCLWHPDEGANHRWVKFRLGEGEDIIPESHDVCSDDPVDVRISGTSSSQIEDAWYGDGTTNDDIVFNDTTVCMRAERNIYRYEDRIYTIALRFEDGSGNYVHENVQVRVPYDYEALSDEEKIACGNIKNLEFVGDDDQECGPREGQYPSSPPPPPPWCNSSIVNSSGEQVGFPVFIFIFSFLIFLFIRRKN